MLTCSKCQIPSLEDCSKCWYSHELDEVWETFLESRFGMLHASIVCLRGESHSVLEAHESALRSTRLHTCAMNRTSERLGVHEECVYDQVQDDFLAATCVR
jgi:hypothetical protein